MGEGFQRQCRLTSKRDFSHVFKNAISAKDGYITVLWRPNAVGNARLGLAISKKYLKKATDRNRVKRLIRESFRKTSNLLPRVDIVVLASRSIAKADSKEVNSSLFHHWNSIINRHNYRPIR